MVVVGHDGSFPGPLCWSREGQGYVEQRRRRRISRRTRETKFQHQKCEKGPAGIRVSRSAARVYDDGRTRVKRCSSHAKGTGTMRVATNTNGIEPVYTWMCRMSTITISIVTRWIRKIS